MERVSEDDKVAAILRNYGVDSAYLFGSRARGHSGPMSDADIAVLFSEEVTGDERFARCLQLSSRLAGPMGASRVDVVDLDTAQPALAYRVITEGRLIRSGNDVRRVRFEARAYQRYFDLKPLLTLCGRGYLQALGRTEGS